MPSDVPEPGDPSVSAYFSGQPARNRLERLRGLIFRTAAETPGVGAMAESLKWGEPSYAPRQPRVGSSVRLAGRPNGGVAMHFICHTGLVDRFRYIYPDAFVYEGNRTLLFEPGAEPDEAALAHCIALALTYHLSKRSS